MSTSIARPRTTRARTERKRRWLRARVWLNRRALDRRLAEGTLPASSPELECRAEQLPLFHPSPEETLDRTVRRIRAALLLR